MTHHRAQHHKHTGNVHKHTHASQHHRHKHGKSEAHKAWDYAVDRPIRTFWKDVVKPVVALPSEAIQAVDKTVSVFDSPLTVLVIGGVAALTLLRR